jgi:hypothetical protein
MVYPDEIVLRLAPEPADPAPDPAPAGAEGRP